MSLWRQKGGVTDGAWLATGFGLTSISCKVGGTFQLGGTSLRHRIQSHWCMSFTAEKRSWPCCYNCYISQILGQLKKEAMVEIVKETLLHWYGFAICQINWHRFDLFWLCMIWDELLCAWQALLPPQSRKLLCLSCTSIIHYYLRDNSSPVCLRLCADYPYVLLAMQVALDAATQRDGGTDRSSATCVCT